MSDTGMKYKPADEMALIEKMLSPDIMLDPYKFVMYAFPWGKTGTPLANKRGPRKWQAEELRDIGIHNYENQIRLNQGQAPIPYSLAIASGRGPGKSALVSWLALWALSTQIGSTVIITANTEQQLFSRTWAELSKWHTLAINSHWFHRTATALRPKQWFDVALREKTGIDTAYYYAQGQLWSEENPDAFAGAHNEKGIVLIYDEASGIPKTIWTVSEGFFTEPIYCRLWIAFSNPRRHQGEFYECFHKNKKYWKTRHIDSRTVEETDRAIYDKIIEKYGEDSDEARVEVKGQFPRTGSNQLIGYGTTEEACRRTINDEGMDIIKRGAKVMGVDVARFGDDSTVIQKRQGRFAHKPIELKKKDNMEVAGIVASEMDRWGMEWNIIEVDSGSSADKAKLFLNKRIEMWDKTNDWLLAGGVIPDHTRLKEDLNAPVYTFTPTTNKKILESVDSMKARGLPSPDFGTALALTNAYTVEFGGDVCFIDVGGGQGVIDRLRQLQASKSNESQIVDKFDPFAIPVLN